MNRAQPGNLLVVEDRPYLIDIGVGSIRNLAGAGLTPQDVGSVFVTLQHLDHEGGLTDFIAFSSFGNRRQPVDIISSGETEEMEHVSIDYREPSRRVFVAENLANAADLRSIYKGKNIGEDGRAYHDDKVEVFAGVKTHYHEVLRALHPIRSRSFGKT